MCSNILNEEKDILKDEFDSFECFINQTMINVINIEKLHNEYAKELKTFLKKLVRTTEFYKQDIDIYGSNNIAINHFNFYGNYYIKSMKKQIEKLEPKIIMNSNVINQKHMNEMKYEIQNIKEQMSLEMKIKLFDTLSKYSGLKIDPFISKIQPDIQNSEDLIQNFNLIFTEAKTNFAKGQMKRDIYKIKMRIHNIIETYIKRYYLHFFKDEFNSIIRIFQDIKEFDPEIDKPTNALLSRAASSIIVNVEKTSSLVSATTTSSVKNIDYKFDINHIKEIMISSMNTLLNKESDNLYMIEYSPKDTLSSFIKKSLKREFAQISIDCDMYACSQLLDILNTQYNINKEEMITKIDSFKHFQNKANKNEYESSYINIGDNRTETNRSSDEFRIKFKESLSKDNQTDNVYDNVDPRKALTSQLNESLMAQRPYFLNINLANKISTGSSNDTNAKNSSHDLRGENDYIDHTTDEDLTVKNSFEVGSLYSDINEDVTGKKLSTISRC